MLLCRSRLLVRRALCILHVACKICNLLVAHFPRLGGVALTARLQVGAAFQDIMKPRLRLGAVTCRGCPTLHELHEWL